jgi:hypothetical protein
MALRHQDRGTKVEVDFLILARHAERSADGSFSMLGAAFDNQAVLAFPVYYPIFYAVAKINLELPDLLEPHVIVIRFIDQNDHIIMTGGEMPLLAQVMPQDRPCLPANIILAMQNVLFPTAGLYRCQLLIDGHIEKTATLRFEQQLPIAP